MARIIISPNKYVQGNGELKHIAKHARALGSHFFIIGTSTGLQRVKQDILQGFDGTDAKLHFEPFNGECSKKEIERLRESVEAHGCDAIIGVGGGKTLDTAKAVAYYATLPVAIVPTIASTDAPCSALSVLYTDDGVFEEYLFLPSNPNLVLVDTAIVCNAPVRLLVAGMGDALATYFEGRAAAASNVDNCAGGKCTLAALSLARLCYETLLADGLMAKLAMERNVCTKAVENIIEANTLLSGLGFESAGLAAAHAVHNGFTAIPETHSLYHGEKVAFGTLVQLVLENAPTEELSQVLRFCNSVGLPTTLADLGIGEADSAQLREVAALAAAEGETIHNMPFAVDADMVYAAILAADSLGASFK